MDIDDDVLQLKAMSDCLCEYLEVSVLTFKAASDLMAKIETLPKPDAVLMDVALAGGPNGYQLSEEILRRRPDVTARCFCFVTGWTRQATGMPPDVFLENALLDKGTLEADVLVSVLRDAMGSC